MKLNSKIVLNFNNLFFSFYDEDEIMFLIYVFILNISFAHTYIIPILLSSLSLSRTYIIRLHIYIINIFFLILIFLFFVLDSYTAYTSITK